MLGSMLHTLSLSNAQYSALFHCQRHRQSVKLLCDTEKHSPTHSKGICFDDLQNYRFTRMPEYLPMQTKPQKKKNRQKTRVNQKNGSILICDAPTRSSKATTWNDILAYQNVCFFCWEKKGRHTYTVDRAAAAAATQTQTQATGIMYLAWSIVQNWEIALQPPSPFSLDFLYIFFSRKQIYDNLTSWYIKMKRMII